MAQAVQSLKKGRADDPSGIREEDLKRWLIEASRETDPVTNRWKLLVQLIHTTFKDGVVPEEVVWAMMVFPPKGRGAYRWIGLAEVVWKVCVTMVNCWLNRSVAVQKALHGFRAGRGTGTETLEAELVQQLVGLEHEPLFQVFLDMR